MEELLNEKEETIDLHVMCHTRIFAMPKRRLVIGLVLVSITFWTAALLEVPEIYRQTVGNPILLMVLVGLASIAWAFETAHSSQLTWSDEEFD
jgi:hypothetical protein